MKLLVKRVFTWLLKLLLVFIVFIMVFIFVYSAISWLLMLFPVNNTQSSLKADKINHTNNNQSTTIFIQHGLAHTNIIIDLSSSSIVWGDLLPNLVPKQVSRQERGKAGFLLVGWGDKATYQSTPNWADLKASVAIKALFINTPSALHIRYLEDLGWLGDSVIPLALSKTTSHAIENRILDSFRYNKPEILSLGYDAGDRFYYSKGQYNIFNTCNTWTGDVLRQSGVSMSLWTPFSYNVVHSLSGMGSETRALEP